MEVLSRESHQPLVAPGAIDHHADDMTVTFAADVTLAQLQAHLADRHQWLPIDGAMHNDRLPAGGPDGPLPLGELMLRNSTGPLRLGFGAWRDVLLGAQFVSGDGRLITVGGRVLKNVAGYDITKLLVGSHGVFGKPVTLTARTWRRPAGALHVEVDPQHINMTSLIASALRPQWAVQFGGDAMMLGYLGDDAALAFYDRAVQSLHPTRTRPRTVDEDAEQRYRMWPVVSARARVSVPPDKINQLIAAAGLWPFMADPSFGIVLALGTIPVDSNRIGRAARECSGRASLYDSNGMPTRISIDPSAYALLLKLKQAFDPGNKLAQLPRNDL